jgi:hypothetical protein
MYREIIEELCRELLSEIQFEKNGKKKKWKRGKVYIGPLGGVEIFQGSVENPLTLSLTADFVSLISLQ